MSKRFLTPINVLNAASDPGSANEGDLYYNTSTDKLRIYSNSSWVDVSSGGGGGGGGATGGGTDEIFWENGQSVTTNYTITTSKNAGTFGPIEIDSGVTVTIPAGSTWTII